jgi:hypothetical protein
MEVNGHLHAPAAFNVEIRAAGTRWIGGCMSPEANVDGVAKKSHYYP